MTVVTSVPTLTGYLNLQNLEYFVLLLLVSHVKYRNDLVFGLHKDRLFCLELCTC